jgi:hypothetical protein
MKWKDSYNPSEIKDELEDDYLREGQYSSLRNRRVGVSNLFGTGGVSYILGGIGVLVLIGLIILWASGDDNGAYEKRLNDIEKRIDLLQDRLVTLEGIRERFGQRQKNFESFNTRLNQVEASSAKRMDRIAKQLKSLERKIGASKPKTSAPKPAAQKTPNRIHHVRAGDTLYNISRQYDISIDTLRRLNKLTPDKAIYPGQKLNVGPAESR